MGNKEDQGLEGTWLLSALVISNDHGFFTMIANNGWICGKPY